MSTRVEVGRGRARSRQLIAENRAGYLFLLPWFIGLLAIVVGPMVASLYLSFTDYNPLTTPEWVGLDNYIKMFTADPRYLKSVGVTLTYVFVSVPLQLAFALGLALLLDRGVRGLAIYRSVYYLPSLLGASVAIAILWRQVFGGDGIFNDLLAMFGIQGISWISTPSTAVYTLVALSVWTFGAPMVIFLAGLRQIPEEFYEAASVDGAGRFRKLFSITIPLLTPVIFFNLVLQMIGAFQAFTQAFIVSDGTGGPVDSTLFYTLYLYQEGFARFRMGYASAMAWVLLAVIALFTAINFIASRYWVFYGDER
ncbi:sugar ABC transporter permease [Microbacterium sp. ET2]|uniref:carbohydrate ABC transporter permease n=1 Tax=Microbacterium albipurpureum TaxID=3050384 RepID=UPI00259C9087|nr:sugar ABC transporter permease [Microbacterium sp. ET2 (Ac-2212)]WJL96965.1 sugar ABC transporter permease [Microbacterium sp. ET2 (Ac-2212)]